MITGEDISALIYTAIVSESLGTERTAQSEAGLIGPSDLGFCRQKVALMTKGVKPTDPNNYPLPSWIGTKVGEAAEAAIKASFPDWIVGSIDKVRVAATFPCGAVVSGTPDLIVPSMNAVFDLKTKDGLGLVEHYPTSQNYTYQRWTYVKGAIELGLLDPTQPVYVGNVYLDRSGRTNRVYSQVEEWDPSMEAEIDNWITDVIYAVTNDEDAARDIPAPVCEKICEHFTACRGGALPQMDGGLITLTEHIQAVDLYQRGRDMEKEGKRLKADAQSALEGVEGVAGDQQVRWVHVNSSEVPAFKRAGYSRLDIRKVRKG